MKFEDVTNAKEALPYTEYIIRDMPMKVYIVPNLFKDFENYMNYFKMNRVTDDSAKLFSSDGLYILCGIWFDGVNIVFDRGLKHFVDINEQT